MTNYKKILYSLSLGVLLAIPTTPIHAIDSTSIAKANLSEEILLTWGGSGSDSFNDIIGTQDGGYVLIGETNSTEYKTGSRSAMIMKTNESFEIEWSNFFGGNGSDTFSQIIETTDGGYLVAGSSTSTDLTINNRGQTDIILVKYDANGNQQWLKTIAGNKDDYLTGLTLSPDGGFVVVGYTDSTDLDFLQAQKTDAFIIKYDSNGNQEWTSVLSGNGYDYFRDVIVTSQNKVLVVGSSNSTNTQFTSTGNHHSFIIQYNLDGQQEVSKSWLGTDSQAFYSITETNPNEFVISGSDGLRSVSTVTIQDGYTVKLDSSFNEIWNNTFINKAYTNTPVENQDNSIIKIKSTPDGNLLSLINTTYLVPSQYGYFMKSTYSIVKQNSTGTYNWILSTDPNQSNSDENDYRISSFFPLSEDSFLIIGWTKEKNIYGASDAIVSKFELKTSDDILINGSITPVIANVEVPDSPLTFVLNPNLEEEQQFIAPDLTLNNRTNSPLKVSINSFNQQTTFLNDVLPTFFNSWDGLNKNQSLNIALGIKTVPSDGWLSNSSKTHYAAETTYSELGVIKPKQEVQLTFEALHGHSFATSISPQYKLSLIFELVN